MDRANCCGGYPTEDDEGLDCASRTFLRWLIWRLLLFDFDTISMQDLNFDFHIRANVDISMSESKKGIHFALACFAKSV